MRKGICRHSMLVNAFLYGNYSFGEQANVEKNILFMTGNAEKNIFFLV